MTKGNFLTTFFVGLSAVFFAQTSNKALLWEISKEGMSKKSYIYGTMHVSGKIAYHLGNEFFEALKNVDAIALESNPIIWLDEIFASTSASDYLGKYGITNQIYTGFYEESFKLTIPENKDLGRELSYNHFLTNWMLYRENVGKSDFEEETFLDMFIYQAGRKNGKPVYSLEDFNQSRYYSNMARIPDIEDKQTPSWLKEMTKEKSQAELIQDAYRNQDIDLLDSISRETSSDNYMKYLLYARNYVMVDNIDSLLNTGMNLFIGIGAAHLPNTEGVLNLLREKGYTVNPVSPTITQQSKESKEALSLKKISVPLKTKFETELFSVMIPNKIYETPAFPFQRQFFAPELTNGTFYTIDEISHYNYFTLKNESDYLAKIDSLLFENIPGKILTKTEITKDGYKGLDILNRTKSGDHQRYQIFVSPLKIFVFKMGGKDEFVKNHGDEFFNSITLTKMSTEWKEVSPIKKDFSVEVPSYCDIKGNTQITASYAHPELEAYDPEKNEFFYLTRASLFDFSYIEEDEFELFRIMEKFADQFDADSVYNQNVNLNFSMPSATSETILPNGNYMNMKVVIRGVYYYLLAVVSDHSNANSRFFSSFKLNDFEYTYPFELRTDSILMFTVNSNYLAPDDFKGIREKALEKKRTKDDKDDKSYLAKNKFDIFYSENFERINVEFIKFHRYSHFDNTDSLWDRQTKSWMKERTMFVYDEKRYSAGDTNYLEITYADTGSYRLIYKKYIQFNDLMYVLTTNADTVNKPSKFVTEFYATFKPLQPEKAGRSLFDDKTFLFFDALKGDSLDRDIAYKSILTHVIFEDEHAGHLMEVIKNHPFPAEHTPAKAQMIQDLGTLKDERIMPFLVNLYSGMEDTALYQISILRALANQKNRKSCEAIIQLLESDIPVGAGQNEVRYLLGEFYDSLELTRFLFPKLLDYTFVEDYKFPIYQLLSTGMDSGAVNPKQLTKHYPQILREAKLILKTQISHEQAELAAAKNKKYYRSSYLNEGNYRLVIFSSMLMSFIKDKNVQLYFEKLKLVRDYEVRTDVACEFIKHNMEVDEQEWEQLANDVINYSYLFYRLDEIERLDLFPSEKLSQLDMVESLLYYEKFEFGKDTSVFIKKEFVDAGRKKGYVYFFKSKAENEEKWKLDYVGFQPEDTTMVEYDYTIYKRGLSIAKGENIDELIEKEIKSMRIKYRKRASEKSGNYFGW